MLEAEEVSRLSKTSAQWFKKLMADHIKKAHELIETETEPPQLDPEEMRKELGEMLLDEYERITGVRMAEWEEAMRHVVPNARHE